MNKEALNLYFLELRNYLLAGNTGEVAEITECKVDVGVM